jgi:ATP-dependent RNA helicase DDX19/DBP5
MADSKASPPSDSSGIAKSFADRLTFPDKKNDDITSAEPKKFNWADDAEAPVESTPAAPSAQPTIDIAKSQTDGATDDSLAMAQTDGASSWLNGSGLNEPEFDVNVKLADLQDDPNNPLYSISSFEELNL